MGKDVPYTEHAIHSLYSLMGTECGLGDSYDRKTPYQQNLQLGSLTMSQAELLASLFKTPRLLEKGDEEYEGMRG